MYVEVHVHMYAQCMCKPEIDIGIFYFILFLFCRSVLVCSPGRLDTLYVEQAVFELT